MLERPVDAKDLRKERRREQVREEILDAARAVLLEKGIAGFTLAAVARQLELTKAALYHYFPNKDALVFELIFQGLAAHTEVVEAAVLAADSGADALAALIRASAEHYATRKDELRLAYLVPQVGTAGAATPNPDELARIRPFNDRMYGSVADKIAADQKKKRIAKKLDGRRLAFLAHTSVIGMLTVEGLVEVADTAPLIHRRDAMVDELVATFTARLAK